MTTIFVAPEDWNADRLEISGDKHHHLFRVARLARGERVRIADGIGRARAGMIATVRSDRAEIELLEEVVSNEPPVEVELLVAAPKKSRAEWLVEKATELGVFSIRFLSTERGPRALRSGSFERLRRIARSAAEQCERSRLPEVSGMYPGEALSDLVSETHRRFVFDGSGQRLAPLEGSGRIAAAVGPEGGWSQAELERLADCGFASVTLGSRTLRVETAGMLAVATLCCGALTPLEGGR